VLLSTGTLYGALQRLLDNGWIERVEEDDTRAIGVLTSSPPAGGGICKWKLSACAT